MNHSRPPAAVTKARFEGMTLMNRFVPGWWSSQGPIGHNAGKAGGEPPSLGGFDIELPLSFPFSGMETHTVEIPEGVKQLVVTITPLGAGSEALEPKRSEQRSFPVFAVVACCVTAILAFGIAVLIAVGPTP